MSPKKNFRFAKPPCLIKPTGMTEEEHRAHLLRMVTDPAYRLQQLQGLVGQAEKAVLGSDKPLTNQ